MYMNEHMAVYTVYSIYQMSHLDKIKAAQFGLGAKLPFALCICVVQLTR